MEGAWAEREAVPAGTSRAVWIQSRGAGSVAGGASQTGGSHCSTNACRWFSQSAP